MSKAATFERGIHPKYNKEIASGKAITQANLPQRIVVPVSQHIGAPAKAEVIIGDEVKKGQVLAEAGGFVSSNVHAPTSGTVSMVKDTPGPVGGKVPAVEITSDGNDDWGELMPPIGNWRDADPAEVHECLAEVHRGLHGGL